MTIHNYFFAKAIDQVRPGGIVAFVTSRYTMDSKDSTARKHMAERADADLYDSANFEAKKMVVNQLIRRVDVYRGYQINISFNFDLTPYIEGE